MPGVSEGALAESGARGRLIVARDLKPENIKVRADGAVKVLDFGLAKAMDPAGASRVNAMNSPTLSMHATQAGIISRHGRLHESRTGARQGGRTSGRHLGIRTTVCENPGPPAQLFRRTSV